MKLLVTGGAGFIGFHLAEKLVEKGNEIVIVDNLSDYYDVKLKESRLKQLGNKVKFCKADISDLNSMEKVFSENKFDMIVHLAAQAGVRYSLINPHIYEKTNILGTLNIFEMAKKFGIKKIVYASSSSVYGGNKKIPFDKQSYQIWLNAGFKKSQIIKEGREDNFWGPTGDEGPCGPTTEVYLGGTEVWNIVFNEYFKDKKGNLVPLAKRR